MHFEKHTLEGMRSIYSLGMISRDFRLCHAMWFSLTGEAWKVDNDDFTYELWDSKVEELKKNAF